MIFRLLTPADREEAAELWHLAFPEDSEAFVRWYFENRYAPDSSSGCFIGGRLVSVIHGTPMRLTSPAGAVFALMVSGVATLKEWEGRGLMHRNMLFLREEAEKHGIRCLFNHPAHPGTYARLGFRPCSKTLYAPLSRALPELPHGYTAAPFEADSAFSLYEELSKRYTGFRIRTKEEFLKKTAEYFADEGEGLLLVKNGAPEGYAVYFPSEDGIYAEECLCRGSFGALLSALRLVSGAREGTAKLPPDAEAAGELRVQNVMLAPEEIYGQLCSGIGFCIDEF